MFGVNDIDRWKIQQLGSAGFSHKCIAARVWYPQGTPVEDIPLSDSQLVAKVLYEKSILVTEYRNGKTELAAQTIESRLQVKSKKRRKVG